MRIITITDNNGVERTGKWNEKTYSSKVGEDFVRVYIDNKEVHVTRTAIEQLGFDLAAEDKRKKEIKLEDYVSTLSIEEKTYLLDYLFWDNDTMDAFRRQNGLKLKDLRDFRSKFSNEEE